MRLSRFARSRRQTTPYLWGWSVFTFPDGSGTAPVHTFGMMQAAGLQFDPYRERIDTAPFDYAANSVYQRPYITFSSRATSPSPAVNNTTITAVATGGAHGRSTTVTTSNTTIFVKQTKNRVRIDLFFRVGAVLPTTLDLASVECAIGRL